MAMDVRIFIEPQQGATYGDQLAVAREAERLGFSAFFRSDHFLRMGGGSGLPGPTDSYVTLAGIARETTTIRLGTLVTSATFRHPGLLAISVAQIDEMSGGRIELGLGAGWFADEHAAYGVPFPDTAERFDRLEEQLAIIHGMWTTPEGERFSHAGRWWPVVDSPSWPRPVQSPTPPIIVGGVGLRRTPALAARYATEFNIPFPAADQVTGIFGRVRAACETTGRDPGSLAYSVALVACCGADEAELARRAAAIGREPAELRDNGIAGTPQECRDRMATFAALGVERLYLQILDLADLDHLAVLADALLERSTLL
jgi:F420-dependent oxidoreductase-like protein